MSQDGYTLAEALAALLIVGLAIGGLTQGVYVLGRLQAANGRATADARAVRAADRALVALLAEQGPFTSKDPERFTGDRRAFHFECGGAVPCGARLVGQARGARLAITGAEGRVSEFSLPNVPDPWFVYVDAVGRSDAWPPAGPHRTLSAVSLVSGPAGQETPLANARLWIEQAPDCQFDSISQDCRELPR